MATLQELGKLLQQVLSSFHASDTPPDVRRSAGTWLEEFQSSPEAWAVAASLLQNEVNPPDLHLFAAVTLKTKIVKDLAKLDRQQWPHLKEVLMQCIPLHTGGPKEVLTQIFLGVVGLGAVWRDWDDPISDVQMRTNRINFLSFLKLVAEESSGLRGRGVHGASVDLGQIRRWSGPVLKYIGDIWNNPAESAEIVQAINCFSAWVQVGALYEAELNTYEASAHKCFGELDSSHEEISEAAERSVRSIAECAPSVLLGNLANEIASLIVKAKQEVLVGNTSGRVYTWSMQLFGECMMGNLEGLLCNSQNGAMLRQSLLQSVAFPSENTMAIVPVLETCEAVAKFMREVDHGNNLSHLISKTERQEFLGGIMRATVPQAGKLCRNLKGDELAAVTLQELQLHLCDAIGANSYIDWVMAYMSTRVAEGYSWERVECGLYCSEAIAPILQQLPGGGGLSLAFLRGVTHIQLQHDESSLVLIIKAVSSSVSALVDVVVCQDSSLQEFDDLFMELANLLIQGLDIQGGSQASAEALQKLLSTAIHKNVSIPLCVVSSVMRKAKELDSSGQKMDALLGTTIAAVRNVDDAYPMALREQAASQALAPIQEILASAVSHAAITGPSQLMEERLGRALELINRLLEDTAIWCEDFDGDTRTMDEVNPMLHMITTSLWPNLVHLCLHGLGSNCLHLLSNTASLVLSQMKKCDQLFVRGLLEICQNRFFDGGHCFVGPLCTAAASQFAASENFLSVVEFICSGDRYRSICSLPSADEIPDVIISIFSLSGCVMNFHTQFPTDRAMAIAQRGLECAAVFCGCHHKDVVNAAVAYIKLATYSIIHAPNKCEPLIRCIEINGGRFVQNLIGGILIPVPLPRVHNIVTLLVLLATVLGQYCSEGQCPFTEWLRTAFAAHQAVGLSSELATAAVAEWTPIITGIWEHSRSVEGTSMQLFTTKRAQMLRKIIREFADKYMRVACSQPK